MLQNSSYIKKRPRCYSFAHITMTTHNNIYYSDRYNDDEYEYRHVIVPKEMVKKFPKDRMMSEDEWRSLGIQQSQGWVHYMIHKPEPHILMFKRAVTK